MTSIKILFYPSETGNELCIISRIPYLMQSRMNGAFYPCENHEVGYTRIQCTNQKIEDVQALFDWLTRIEIDSITYGFMDTNTSMWSTVEVEKPVDTQFINIFNKAFGCEIKAPLPHDAALGTSSPSAGSPFLHDAVQ